MKNKDKLKANRRSERSNKIESNGSETAKFKRKDYEKNLEKLQAELVKLQEWVKHEGRKVCLVFEGRDGAGKGGTIKAITARVSPRTRKAGRPMMTSTTAPTRPTVRHNTGRLMPCGCQRAVR